MTRSSKTTKRSAGSDHADRGDGTCCYCFEEWPCPVSLGKAYVSGIHKWNQDESLARQLEESLRRVERAKEMKDVFKRLGYDIHVSEFSTNVTVPSELMHEIALKLDERAEKG